MDIFETAKTVLQAVRGGQGFLAASLALVLLVACAKKYLAPKYAWAHSDIAGSLMTLLGSFGGMTATALAAGTMPSWSLAGTALGVAVTASGGYSMVKKLAAPALRALEAKIPLIKPVADLLLWAFEKRDPVAEAEKAGDAAVKANPGKGLGAVIEDVDDLR